MVKKNEISNGVIISAGSTYLDIDAYACCVAMQELLALQGRKAVAYSSAPCNYSVCSSLVKDEQIVKELPSEWNSETADYIIVDVSDPDYIKDGAPLNRVVAVYDHHTGFEDYWSARIGTRSHIEFIGAAATLIYREWKKAGLQDQMTRDTTLLLIAAILDNTLNLTSSNTTQEDVEAFQGLCRKENVGEAWCASYFSEVQKSVEADLENALFGDIKTVRNNAVLPSRVAQISVWDAYRLFEKLPEIRSWFNESSDSWMINVIDIRNRCSYFVCDNNHCQVQIEKTFDVRFEAGVARSSIPYLRKEIVKKTQKSH